MYPQYPLRFGTLSSLRGTGLRVRGATAHLTAESTFWQLEPGVNIVTFSAPSGSVEVTIEYASRYTGV